MFETCSSSSSSSTARHVTFTYFPAVFVLERKYFKDVVKYTKRHFGVVVVVVVVVLPGRIGCARRRPLIIGTPCRKEKIIKYF